MKFETNVPGWMTPADLSVLHKLASLVPDNGSILEAGCFLGRSTSALYAGKKKSVSLTVVDTFQTHTGYDTHYDMFRERTAENGDKYFDAFGDKALYYTARDIATKENSWLNGFRHCVGEEIYNSISVNKTKFDEFTHSEYDLAFVDASHTKQDVIKDIKRFINNPNTLLVGDDFNHKHPDVLAAVVEVRRTNRHLLIVPEDSKIWILVPKEGYWKEQFKEINSCFF
jgi:predicted O-methyltransferase YrrM